MTWTAPQITRTDEPPVADERILLEGFLDRHRATLLHKCAGLTGAQLHEASVAPSTLTLLGLVRHMADVERVWFRRRVRGEAVASLYAHPDGRGGASFDLADPAFAEADLATLAAEQQACREAVAGASLDDTFVHERTQETMSLRWVYLHMIEEYARHNGHADLIREAVDGVTGE
ncbi:DinB family protein [Catellatospora vulcania]|uniref:DinB family protein n=1 Tax=Catellatospora vulcania TaxID=1460450 RepID=UPI0012D3E65C|nr:DinB family protein [Catellatospora vulcania]